LSNLTQYIQNAKNFISSEIEPILSFDKTLKVSPDGYTFFTKPNSTCSANEAEISGQIESDLKSNNEISIYIHFPVCKYLCGFCHYPKKKDGSLLINKSVELLLKEISLFIQKYPEIKEKKITSFYIGGGTPTLMGKEQLQQIFNAFTGCNFSDECEKTIEGTPDTLSKDKITSIITTGFNRVSMGVQTLDQRLLSHYKREHKPEDSLSALNLLLIKGIKTNIDLIYGFSGQSVESLLKDIDKIVSINDGPSSITLYRLRLTRIGDEETEAMKEYKKNPGNFLSQEKVYLMKLSAANYLRDKGYYENPIGFFHKKNESIKVLEDRWKKQIPMFGFGWKAYSYSQNMQYQNEKDFELYRYYIDSREELPLNCGDIFDENNTIKKRFCFSMKYGEPFIIEQSEYKKASKIIEIDKLIENEFITVNEKDGKNIIRITETGNILIEEIINSYIFRKIQLHPFHNTLLKDVM